MIGSNVPTTGGLPQAFKYADEWGCQCIQIYVAPSRRWDIADLTSEEVITFKAAWAGSTVQSVVGHIPFLVNLASPNGDLRDKSISRVINEINRAGKLGVCSLVLHPGSNPDRKRGLDLVARGLASVLRSTNGTAVSILLETVAGQGNMLGSRFEELAQILESVNADRLGVCFDTCHVYAAGYDIRGYEGCDIVLGRFDKLIGIGRIKAFHFNDSKTDLGSCVDRHASIGEGFVGLQPFHAILRHTRFAEVPKILEIPCRDKESEANLALLQRLLHTETPVPWRCAYPSQLTLNGVANAR